VLPADGGRGLLNLGGTPIDLGGIGKGLAARWAAAELDGAGASVLVDAGGDEWLGGPGPDGDGWLVGVEDPFGATADGDEQPILVLALTDVGVATSSVRRRRWRTGDAAVHHLVDPRTGLPGGSGLAQVTVVHPDPAWAEVWSKTLFLTGPDEVAAQAEARGLAAAWVTADGATRTSPALDPSVIWRAQ
jgi:thiamine biosynthesis lipoprotein